MLPFVAAVSALAALDDDLGFRQQGLGATAFGKRKLIQVDGHAVSKEVTSPGAADL